MSLKVEDEIGKRWPSTVEGEPKAKGHGFLFGTICPRISLPEGLKLKKDYRGRLKEHNLVWDM